MNILRLDLKSLQLVVSANYRTGVAGVEKNIVVSVLTYDLCGGAIISHSIEFTYLLYFRADSVAELYTYLPLTPENAERLKCVPPHSIENSDYGFSVGRGAFHLDVAVGQWVAVALRIKLNDIGSTNGCSHFVIVERDLLLTLTYSAGQIQLWINGNSVIDLNGVTLRDAEAGRIRGMHFQTFFGGMLLKR